MEKVIEGFSVNNQLLTGLSFYGEIGTLVSVVRKDNRDLAVMKNNEGEYVTREAVIDTSISLTSNGPVVRGMLFVGESESQLYDEDIRLIENGFPEAIGEGSIDVDFIFQGANNSVYVGEDGFIRHLQDCKYRHDELPLTYAIQMMPYEQEVSKGL